MKLDESIRGIWFCSLSREQDLLLFLNYTDEEQYEITYRFRYYHSDDPFDEEDKKSWYSLKNGSAKNEKEIIETIHDLFSDLTLMGEDIRYTEMLRGDQSLDEFVDEFMKQDFVHAERCH
jgi:hypothetical protein